MRGEKERESERERDKYISMPYPLLKVFLLPPPRVCWTGSMTLWWLLEDLALRVALQWPTISLEARSSEECNLMGACDLCCTILVYPCISHTTHTYTHKYTHRVHGVSVDHTLEYFCQRVTEHLRAVGVEGVLGGRGEGGREGGRREGRRERERERITMTAKGTQDTHTPPLSSSSAKPSARPHSAPPPLEHPQLPSHSRCPPARQLSPVPTP